MVFSQNKLKPAVECFQEVCRTQFFPESYNSEYNRRRMYYDSVRGGMGVGFHRHYRQKCVKPILLNLSPSYSSVSSVHFFLFHPGKPPTCHYCTHRSQIFQLTNTNNSGLVTYLVAAAALGIVGQHLTDTGDPVIAFFVIKYLLSLSFSLTLTFIHSLSLSLLTFFERKNSPLSAILIIRCQISPIFHIDCLTSCLPLLLTSLTFHFQ